MDILLTPEEIDNTHPTHEEYLELQRKCETYHPQVFKGLYQNDEWEKLIKAKIAKAQLKKLIDEAVKQKVIELKDGQLYMMDSNFGWKFWQSILDEIKGNR